MTSMMWGPSAEVLDPRAALHADDARTDRVEVMLDQVDDENGGVDWDDPESWYDEGGSGSIARRREASSAASARAW